MTRDEQVKLEAQPQSISLPTCLDDVEIQAEVGDNNAARLVAAFEAAWLTLDRHGMTHLLLEHWESASREQREFENEMNRLTLPELQMAPVPVPRIALEPNLDDMKTGAVAAHQGGCIFRFSSAHIAGLTEPALVALVGHELVHAYRKINGSRSADRVKEERLVMRLTQKLGFDQAGLLACFGRKKLEEQ